MRPLPSFLPRRSTARSAAALRRLRRFAPLLVLPCLIGTAEAFAASLSLSTDPRRVHAGIPFTLVLTAKGFQEQPVPATPEVAIEGAEVRFLGVKPSVATHVQIAGGKRTERREVTFVYRWRVTPPGDGRYNIPELRLEQNGVAARHPAATFQVHKVASTPDMVVRLQVPDRPLWVGEHFDATVMWRITRNVQSYEFAVPLFDLDGVEVEAPPKQQRNQRTLRFMAGASEVNLPFRRDQVTVSKRRFTRLRATARVLVHRPGVYELDPVRVVAQLRGGGGANPGMFRAEGQRRRLTVRSLPRSGRPETFVDAVGSAFSIDVQASRTVVSVGDPIELIVRLRGDVPLTGMSLPPLGGPEGLPSEYFSVPEGNVAGEVDEASKSKTFRITVRVKSAEAREIPPIAFSYFDPKEGEYRTVESQSVALAVSSADVVGATDVVAAPTTGVGGSRPRGESGGRSGAASVIATLVGADMSLSPRERTFARAWGSGDVRLLLGALYGLPLVVLGAVGWFSHTGGRRAHGRAVREALQEAESALDVGGAAREAAPRILAAMRELARVTGGGAGEAATLLEQLETRAFDPQAEEVPVDEELVAELRRIAHAWTAAAAAPVPERNVASAAREGAAGATAAALLFAVTTVLALSVASTEAAAEATDEEGRSLYQAALDEPDRLRRVRLFESAEQALRPVAALHLDAPELQADWGNAALGAQDVGRAVLAYRRALRFAPGHERARVNLAWLRDRLPVWMPRPATDATLDSFLFWRGWLTTTQLHLVGGAAFAAALLLLAPWPAPAARRRRLMRQLAVPAFGLWALALGSVMLTPGNGAAAVVLFDGATLRSADSAGASPSFANPLPAGTEVTVLEARGAWSRIALADGTRGWLSASAIERVAPLADASAAPGAG